MRLRLNSNKMSGIYIHIPFCKQACHYCDFHFSTNLKKKEEMVLALAKEIEMRSHPITESIETIYFGGGTPSVLGEEEIAQIFEVIHQSYKVSDNAEITLDKSSLIICLISSSNSIVKLKLIISCNKRKL